MIFPEGFPSAFMSLYISAYPLLSRFFGENGTDSLWIDRCSEYFGQGFTGDIHGVSERAPQEILRKNEADDGEDEVEKYKNQRNTKMNVWIMHKSL